MSKLAILSAATLICVLTSRGQGLEVVVTVDDAEPTLLKVEGRFLRPGGMPNLSFLNTYAGNVNLADRITDIRLADAEKKPVAFTRMQAGEHLAERNVSSFAYSVDLRPRSNASAAAHVSWLAPEHGMLVLDDLLPQPVDNVPVRMRLVLPRSWRVVTNEDSLDEDTINVHDAQRAVIFVGKTWRLLSVGRSGAKLAIAGEWPFPDAEVAEEANAIYNRFLDIFQAAPAGPSPLFAITGFPTRVSPGNWEAGTRGSIVAIASSGGLSPMDGRQRLRQQLRHELFHLWLPNGVSLNGNYDWFYEGFATYEEQKLGVAMNHLRFTDLLATLARAYDVSRYSTAGRSLISASRERWSGANTQVYARGVVVAFLTDVALLDASKGKRSVETLMRQVFEKHRPPAAPADANDAVTAAMRSRPEAAYIVDRFVSGAEPFDWTDAVRKAGLNAVTQNQLTQLSVVEKPSGRQKDLLDKLGYNSWRKLASE